MKVRCSLKKSSELTRSQTTNERKAGQTEEKNPHQRSELHFTFQAVIQISKTRFFVMSVKLLIRGTEFIVLFESPL